VRRLGRGGRSSSRAGVHRPLPQSTLPPVCPREAEHRPRRRAPPRPQGLELKPWRRASPLQLPSPARRRGGRTHLPAMPPASIVPGRVAAHRAIFVAVTARPKKHTVGPGLGRCFSLTPDTARHDESIRPHSVGLYRAGSNRARAGLGTDGPLEYYSPHCTNGITILRRTLKGNAK
jgi:hypothetical protein